VQRYIDELLKHLKRLQEQKQEVGGMRAELKDKVGELRKKIPEGMIQPGQGDEEDDEDEEGKDQPKPESGFQDRAGDEGEKRGITPEIAQQILEALGINGDRKLPVGGDEQQTKPRNKNGKEW
jgi:hypothetical protein